MRITRFQKWMLKRICRVIVIQGFDHKSNIIEYYQVMEQAAREQFNEDNRPTLDSFLEECHKESLAPPIHYNPYSIT